MTSMVTTITTMIYNRRKNLIVVLGATATGKTDVSVALARRLGTEIVSCDSRQMYRELPIGTAMPSPEQLAQVKHHFIASRSIVEPYTSGLYEQDALVLLAELFVKYDNVVMVGGSGLYINAVCDGFDEIPPTDPTLRESLTSRLRNEGLDCLLEELRRLDPKYYEKVDRNNPHRVMRALEVCITTGHPYSSIRSGAKVRRPFNIIKVGVAMPRTLLYDRINRRVDIMVEQGLEQEARNVYSFRNMNALQTVGYSEMFDFFDGKISREEAIELIKRNSRRYAKRQDTWFARDSSIMWFDSSEEGVADTVFDYVAGAL